MNAAPRKCIELLAFTSPPLYLCPGCQAIPKLCKDVVVHPKTIVFDGKKFLPSTKLSALELFFKIAVTSKLQQNTLPIAIKKTISEPNRLTVSLSTPEGQNSGRFAPSQENSSYK